MSSATREPNRDDAARRRAVAAAQAMSLAPTRRDEAVTRIRAAVHVAERTAGEIALVRRWQLWAGLAWVGVAACLLLMLTARPSPAPVPLAASQPLPPFGGTGTASLHQAPTWLAERVAVMPQPGARFVVEGVQSGRAQLRVDDGLVALRLYPGSTSFRLDVEAADTRVEAVGTIFAVGVVEGEARVRVHDGEVKVTRAGRVFAVHEDEELRGEELTKASPEAAASPLLTLAGMSPPSSRQPRAPDRRATSTPATAPAPDPTPVELWRRARLARGQARYDEAIAALERLRRSDDPTWAPLALLELARLELDVLGDPGRAAALAEEFRIRFADHALAPEMQVLECRARHQKGEHDDDCVP